LLLLELAKILTLGSSCKPVAVNITLQMVYFTIHPRKYKNLLLMQRKAYSFWGLCPKIPLTWGFAHGPC